MEQLTTRAYAKINLGLDVIQKLPNGYHQVKMIMQAIDLWDELTLEKAESGIVLTTDAEGLPTDGSNLICRAAGLMLDAFSLKEGLKIHLRKRIPMAAGMAGGSADGAAAIAGINRLFRLGLPVSELMRISVAVGADVPFCILGGTALAEGIGEELTSLPPLPPCHIVVAMPDLEVSTKFVYEHLDARGLTEHPDIDGMVTAVREGSLPGMIRRMQNVLESVTIPAYPVIAAIKDKMLSLGAAGSLMSGSGPAVFGIFTEDDTAKEAFRQLKAYSPAKQVFLTAPFHR